LCVGQIVPFIVVQCQTKLAFITAPHTPSSTHSSFSPIPDFPPSYIKAMLIKALLSFAMRQTSAQKALPKQKAWKQAVCTSDHNSKKIL